MFIQFLSVIQKREQRLGHPFIVTPLFCCHRRYYHFLLFMVYQNQVSNLYVRETVSAFRFVHICHVYWESRENEGGKFVITPVVVKPKARPFKVELNFQQTKRVSSTYMQGTCTQNKKTCLQKWRQNNKFCVHIACMCACVQTINVVEQSTFNLTVYVSVYKIAFV